MCPIQQSEAVKEYRQQSREFLTKSREYLAEADLHQASEKGWGAASHMVKAVAQVHGWDYEHHGQFKVILANARRLTGNDRIRVLGDVANGLHGNYYERKRFLDADGIRRGLDDVEELLGLLEPLTEPGEPSRG